ncbi:hypothetical protein [Glycomyces salinus]|uniref:hypothetical protein n=1 Tax=Glycomyces salinus TaxID=980294 RepID=UPI0018EC9A30|nr:hypothetical protein [Glycomyces salinus]
MVSRTVYLVAGVTVLVAIGSVVLAVSRPGQSPGEPAPDEIVSPDSAPAEQLEGEELSEYWDDERMSEAEPYPMPTDPTES